MIQFVKQLEFECNTQLIADHFVALDLTLEWYKGPKEYQLRVE